MSSLLRSIAVFFRHFCENTSLHGFQHIYSNTEYKKLKAALWMCLCAFSTIFCVYLIYLQLEDYRAKRIVTIIANPSYPIWKFPFPAVTVCGLKAVFRENAIPFFNLLEKYGINASLTKDFFYDLPGLIHNRDIGWTGGAMEKYRDIVSILNSNGYDTNNLMKKLAQPCDSLLRNCVWANREYNCSRIFQLILTTMGYCCSFNYTAQKSVNSSKVLIGRGMGPSSGLSMTVLVNNSHYMPSVSSELDVVLRVHESHVFPSMNLLNAFVQPRYRLKITMEPTTVVADEDIRKLPFERRGCCFPSERHSDWAGQYSLFTCLNTFFASIVGILCGCIPFYFPYTGNLRHCTVLDLPCLHKNNRRISHESLLHSIYDRNGAHLNKLVLDGKELEPCCRECGGVNYDLQKLSYILRYLPEHDLSAPVNVFYGTISGTKIERKINVTWDMVLASVGGIFGLCLGGSMLSIAEMLYIFCSGLFKKRTRRKYKPKAYFNELNIYVPKANHQNKKLSVSR